MKIIIALIVLFSICCCCGCLLLYANLDSGQNVPEDPVISKDLFEKAWSYRSDQGNMQTIFVDKNKNRTILVTYQRGLHVLDRKKGEVLCQRQSGAYSGNSKYRSEIIVKTQGDILIMAADGGNDILTYDLNTCETLAEIHLNDLSYICDYTVDIV